MRFDDKSGTCHVFTYKEGMLSAVAHDLKLVVGRWSIDHDPATGRTEGSFDPSTFSVVCAMRDGRPAAGVIAPRDAQKIEGNVRDKVLEVARHREIRFSGETQADGAAWTVTGVLALHGVRQTIRARVERRGAELVTEIRLHQPDFKITPYSAMFGALKVKPEVTVRVAVPAQATGEGA